MGSLHDGTPCEAMDIAVDQPPRLVTWTPPKKLDVQGEAVVAAYVDTKGGCLGGVPLDLPFPGMTQTILDELKNVRFDPAKTRDKIVGSWVVLGLDIEDEFSFTADRAAGE